MVKPRASIVHENQSNAFALVDLKSGKVVDGGERSRAEDFLD